MTRPARHTAGAPLLALCTGLTLLAACTTTPPPPRYDYFAALPASDPFAPKIESWQERELAQPFTLPSEPLNGRAAERSGMLRKKFAAFRRSRRLDLAKEFAQWSQVQARKHYRFDPIGTLADDHWPTFQELLDRNGDDCDGLDLIAYNLMRELGFPTDELFRAIVRRDKDGANHMVTLWFEDPGDPWVIDVTGAMTRSVRRLSEVRGFTPTRIFNERSSYSVLDPDAIERELAARP